MVRAIRIVSGGLLGILPLALFSTALAQTGDPDPDELTQEEVERFEQARDAANDARIEANVAENETGTDPRSFALQWSPFYRYTKLENGLIQHDLVANGVVGFTSRLGMFYEAPVAQYRDFEDVSGVPEGTDAIGMGDWNLKFIGRPGFLEFEYGDDGSMRFSTLLGTEFILPTATDDALAGNALVFAPILGFVFDMPLYGFIAALNLYEFDLLKESMAPDVSRFVGRYFYMQPLTPPGTWWGGFYLLPEVQVLYDFKAEHFSWWVAPEVGKILAPGRILYVKPGWGINNSEPTDREFTVETGFRWFF